MFHNKSDLYFLFVFALYKSGRGGLFNETDVAPIQHLIISFS